MPIENTNHNHEIVWSPEKIKKIWDFYSRSMPKSYFSYHSGKYILDYVNMHVKLYKMNSVLDFGCGPGYLLEQLVKNCGGMCYGLDFSKESIDNANEKLGSKQGFGGAVLANKLPSTFENNSMDMVISVEVVEHLSDEHLAEMLKEIYRVLKPGGYVVVTTPNNEDLEINRTICPECGCIFHRWQHVRAFTRKGLISLMEKKLFQIVKCKEKTFGESRIGSIVRLCQTFIKGKGSAIQPHLIYIGAK